MSSEPEGQTQDQLMLELLRSGDVLAASQLFQKNYDPVIWRIASRLTGNADEAHECLVAVLDRLAAGGWVKLSEAGSGRRLAVLPCPSVPVFPEAHRSPATREPHHA